MSVDVRTFYFTDLAPHPWQENIPNIPDDEFKAFKKDIRKRGVQEPITVSMREGTPVIVDGHQRFRAIKELEIRRVTAIVKEFETEDDEIVYLAGAARYRRHLSDAQKVAMGRAYEAHFRPAAEEAQREGSSKGGKATADRQQPSDRNPTTAKKAAEAVGLSERQYRRGKTITEQATPEVKEAWEHGKVSTNAAYEQTRKAVNPQPEAKAVEITQEEMKDEPAMREIGEVTLKGTVTQEQANLPSMDEVIAEAKRQGITVTEVSSEVALIGHLVRRLLQVKDLPALIKSPEGVAQGLPDMFRRLTLGIVEHEH